ncbi:TetR/AcrR family transcriptional regulator C-terminal domain-containing protein [Nonomuraea endophytica]|uniref:AcrR family transcriptional regulator n=1 Tax=Nonomuraea endophytica TaxID=714136 RepID=A0A7W8A1X1_9ACTN|nr:TetR/AcrR family transcriptional regulator C-terminal domain-containing protein [Nonomuraea endophytica]MBB5078013.1 AcrR family transcriptional regulator [Nonomuraea endophytica]
MPLWIDDEADERPRVPLSRRRVLRAAVELADQAGLDALTMRRVAQELGVEPMSLYHHVANKEAILDGVVEMVIGEILGAVEGEEGPDPAGDWQAALRWRILAAREVLLRHKWAPGVIQTRSSISEAAIAYYEGVLGILRAGGFTYDLAHHALHALGSRAMGFTQEMFEPDNPDDDMDPAMLEQMGMKYPHLAGMMAAIAHEAPETTLSWCDDNTEFSFALDLILEGLERRRLG